MPATSHITIDMCLEEMNRIHKHMVKHYPEMIRKKIINPYQRDHRLAVIEQMIHLLITAKQNKNTPDPNFLQLLNQLP